MTHLHKFIITDLFKEIEFEEQNFFSPVPVRFSPLILNSDSKTPMLFLRSLTHLSDTCVENVNPKFILIFL